MFIMIIFLITAINQRLKCECGQRREENPRSRSALPSAVSPFPAKQTPSSRREKTAFGIAPAHGHSRERRSHPRARGKTLWHLPVARGGLAAMGRGDRSAGEPG